MLVEAVDHLAQGEAHVLEADLLADDVERHRREAPVHLAHHAREHRAVAHAGVEQAHRGRARMDVAELEPDALRHHVLLAAGVDEQQVLLPVVEEAEVLFRRRVARMHDRQRRQRAGADQRQQLRRRIARARGAVLHHELVDPLQGLRSDPRTVAQPRDELAVVHRAPAESGLGHASATAEFGDAAQQAAGYRDLHHSSCTDSGQMPGGMATSP